MMEQRRECDVHYRRDPFTGYWSIVAAERDDRPYEFPPRPPRRSDQPCPFCHEQEGRTPPSMAQWSLPGSAFPWDVNVVPNKFPAVCPLPLEPPKGDTWSGADPPWGQSAPTEGMHEVIIESADHRVDWSEFSSDHLALILHAYRHRLRMAAEANLLKWGLVFKNVGPAAGASIEHAHSQLIALRQIPPLVTLRETRAARHWERTGRCLTCDWLEWELEQGDRVVEVGPELAVICPWFSRVAGECWIVPRQHTCHFMDVDGDTVASLSETLAQVIPHILCGEDRAYNMVLQTPPLNCPHPHAGHWTLQLLPRRVAVAGFEWASGCTINTVAPETAARAMHEAIGIRCGV